MLILFFSFLNYFGFSQGGHSANLLIHYKNDHSVVLIAYAKDTLLVRTNDTLNNSTNVDTLLSNYTIQVDLFPDSTYFNYFSHHLYLDSSSLSTLIKKSNIILQRTTYGYVGSTNYDDLNVKYGVINLAGGCDNNPSEWERTYSLLMSKLLKIRNGPNWKEAYSEDVRKKK